MMMAIFGALLPRFILAVAWANDQAYWGNIFGGTVASLAGFLFIPWTTLVYGIIQLNGMSFLDWIFLLCTLLIDLGTWGIGAFAGRQQASNYRGT